MASLSQRSPTQVARREAVEQRVLEATEELLVGGASFAELRVEEIATRAGLGRTAFYFYFRDKRELLTRLTEEVSEQLYGEAEAWWSSEGDGREQLRRALTGLVGLYREHGPLLRAVVEASAYDDAVAGFWRALVGRFVEATKQRIEAEQRSGRAAELPAAETAFALCWMTERACYQRLVQGASPDDPVFVEALVRAWSGAVYGRLD